MARARRDWGTIREEVRRHLRETDAATSFWDDTQLLDFFNMAKDYREIEMHEAHEGFGVETFTSNLVADQSQYSLPEHTGRVSRVLIVSVDGDSETPLVRMERWGEALSNSTVSGGDGYLPSYRLVGNSIVLEPAPVEARTGGLKIEIEAAAPRTANDADKLPDDYPPFIETLLVYDTVILALDHQGSQTPLPQGIYSSYMRQKLVYEELWVSYIESRSFGKVFGQPFRQGD